MSKVLDPQEASNFRRFAESLQGIILGYHEDQDIDFTKRQKKDVETLVKLEKRFKKRLQEDSRGKRGL